MMFCVLSNLEAVMFEAIMAVSTLFGIFAPHFLIP